MTKNHISQDRKKYQAKNLLDLRLTEDPDTSLRRFESAAIMAARDSASQKMQSEKYRGLLGATPKEENPPP